MPRGAPAVLIAVRVSAQESEWIQAEAERRGTSRTAVVRSAVALAMDGGKPRRAGIQTQPWAPNPRQEALNRGKKS